MNAPLKIRLLHGDPIIHDVRGAQLPLLYRGLPEIKDDPCELNCSACVDICPSGAIALNPLTIDLGKCVFCPECERVCNSNIIHFTNSKFTAVSQRSRLLISRGTGGISPEAASTEIRRHFGRSLKLRQISAGGCNSCELELNALSNVNFDLGRYGIEFVASPRHADGVVLTGPLTKAMAKAAEICYEAVPKPKIIILFGACAISGGIFANSEQLQREFLTNNKIDLYFPGCPPHPLTFINGLLDWLGRK